MNTFDTFHVTLLNTSTSCNIFWIPKVLTKVCTKRYVSKRTFISLLYLEYMGDCSGEDSFCFYIISSLNVYKNAMAICFNFYKCYVEIHMFMILSGSIFVLVLVPPCEPLIPHHRPPTITFSIEMVASLLHLTGPRQKCWTRCLLNFRGLGQYLSYQISISGDFETTPCVSCH